MGLTIVARNHRVSWFVLKSIYQKQTYSVKVAEFLAIHEGLYVASEPKFQYFVQESDCIAAISSVNVEKD